MKIMPELTNDLLDEIRATVNAGFGRQTPEEIEGEIEKNLYESGITGFDVKIFTNSGCIPMEAKISSKNISALRAEYPKAKERYASLVVSQEPDGIHLNWMQGID